MITRDFQVRPVLAFDQVSFDASCVASTDFAGHIIDRLGLDRTYLAAQPFATIQTPASTTTSTAASRFIGLSVRLQHSTTTCAGGFSDFSTQYQSCQQPAINTASATSTAAAPQPGLMSSAAVSTATSTVNTFIVQTQPSWYDLTAAAQYVRIVVTPFCDGTSCTAAMPMTMAGGLIFGEPAELPFRSTSTGIIQKS